MTSTNTTAPARCIECGRIITSAASIARGRGKGCAAKVRRAAATATVEGFTPDQVDAARELVEDAGIMRLRRNIYLTVSTDGERVHRTTATRCTCHAGVRAELPPKTDKNGKLKKTSPCYHQLAVRMLLGGYALAA